MSQFFVSMWPVTYLCSTYHVLEITEWSICLQLQLPINLSIQKVLLFLLFHSPSPPPLPAPPGEVNHTLVTRELLTLQSVRLTWLQPEDNHGHINSYNITYCILVNNSCGQQTQIQTLAFTETAILSHLIPARTYQVYIRAENDVGQGPEPTQYFLLESANQGKFCLHCFYSTSQCFWFSTTLVDVQPVGMNAAFVSATTVVLVWQLPTIGESAGVDSFILSYSLKGDSEENATQTRQPSGETMTRTVSYQQGRTPGVVISGLNSSSLYNFKVSINYSNPVLLSAETSVTVRTDPSGKFNRLYMWFL